MKETEKGKRTREKEEKRKTKKERIIQREWKIKGEGIRERK